MNAWILLRHPEAYKVEPLVIYTDHGKALQDIALLSGLSMGESFSLKELPLNSYYEIGKE